MNEGFIPKVALVVIVLVLVLGGTGAYLFFEGEMTSPMATDERIKEEDGEVIFLPKNFKLQLLSNWQQMAVENILLPQGLDGAQFAAQRQDMSCAFAYIRTSQALLQEYQEISFAERVFTIENDQLDGKWKMYSENLPENFEFNWDGRQPLKREVRMHYYPVSYNDADPDMGNLFVLFSPSGTIVSDICDEEFSQILHSIRSYYDRIILSENSSGIVYIATISDKTPYLLFIPKGDSIARIITELNKYMSTPTVYKEKLWYSAEGELRTFDLVTQATSSVLDIAPSNDEIVKDFYIFKDRLFYLFGSFVSSCSVYQAQCNFRLYEYDFSAEHSSLLAENVTYREILSLNPEENVLYMAYLESDGGCKWAKTGRYDFAQKRVVPGEDLVGCGIDPEVEAMESFLKRVTDALMYDFIFVESGKIVMPEENILNPGNWRPIRYIK